MQLPRKAVQRGYLVVVAVVFALALATSWDDVTRLVRDARLPVLAVAVLASYGQLTFASAFWRSALASFGEPVPYRAALAATLGGLPARYLPGSVWYAVSRVARLHREGARRTTLAAVAALETALIPVIGFTLGALLLALGGGSSSFSRPLLVGAVLLAVASTPPVVNRLLRLLVRIRPTIGTPPMLAWGAHLRLVGWTAGFWLWSGGVFALYLAAFPALDVESPTVVAGAYMVAWGVGWLAVFAPQGVGVFEVTLAALLGGGVSGMAVVLAGYRALIAVRDLLAAGVALLLRRRGSARGSSAPDVVVDEVAPPGREAGAL